MITTIVAALAALAVQQPAEILLPAPTGPHAVGIARRTWVDSARSDSTGPRRLFALIWYPAMRSNARPAAYVPDLDPTASELGALHARVRPHAIADAPFAANVSRAPVIVYAPGRVGAAFDFTSVAEELASHGYVLIAVNSPGHSKIFRADGTLVPVVFPSMPPSTYPNGFDDAQEPMNRLVSTDLRFVIEKLASIDRSDDILRGRLRLDRMAMAGHSNGAMAGSRACAQDSRCLAFLGMEGPQVREVRSGGNDKPFAQVYSDQTLAFDTLQVFTSLRLRGRAPFTLYRVTGAGHNSFTDLLLVRPTLFNYSIDPRRAIDVTRAITRGFFDAQLRRISNGDSLASTFPEVRVERFAAGRTPPGG